VLDVSRGHCGLSVSGAGFFGTSSSQKKLAKFRVRGIR
jgi:hypothetical protein